MPTMRKKTVSTFEREMRDPKFKQAFDKEYSKFLLSELLISLMSDDLISVRKLANEVGLSPNLIQKIRSGAQTDIKLSNFINISHAFGYQLILEKGKRRIRLN